MLSSLSSLEFSVGQFTRFNIIIIAHVGKKKQHFLLFTEATCMFTENREDLLQLSVNNGKMSIGAVLHRQL